MNPGLKRKATTAKAAKKHDSKQRCIESYFGTSAKKAAMKHDSKQPSIESYFGGTPATKAATVDSSTASEAEAPATLCEAMVATPPAPVDVTPASSLTNYEISTELSRDEWEILMSADAMLTSDVLDKTLSVAHEAVENSNDIHLVRSCLASACMEGNDATGLVDSTKFMQIFPLCDSHHWQVCIFVGLGSDRAAAFVLNSARGYTAMSPGIRRLIENVASVHGEPQVHELEVPQQSNGIDCGFFVQHFVEKMMEWLENLRSGDYTNLAWDYKKDARRDLQQCYADKAPSDLVQPTPPTVSTSEVPPALPVSTSEVPPALPVSTSEVPPALPVSSSEVPPSTPACVAIVEDFKAFMASNNEIVLDIQKDMQLSDTAVFSPLISRAQEEHNKVFKAFAAGLTRETIRKKIRALAAAVQTLATQLPEDALGKKQLETYLKELNSRASAVSQNVKAAYEASLSGSAAGLPAPRNQTTQRGRTGADKLKSVLFDLKDLEQPSMGIGADEEVLLSSGESKLMRDLTAGDYVLDPLGKSVKVLKAPTIVDADAFEVTCDCTAMEENLLTRQQMVVGGLHTLEVTLLQHKTKKHYPNRGKRKSSVRQTYTELLARIRLGEWVVVKPRLQTKALTYSASDGMTEDEYALLTPDEAARLLTENKRKAAERLDEIMRQLVKPELRYYAPAHHLVRYKKPQSDSPLVEFYKATTLDTSSRKGIMIPTGLVLDSPQAGLSPERLELDKALEGLNQAQQVDVLYTAGLWVGDGTMVHPHIAVDSVDIESMKRCAEIASNLGLYCSASYQHFEPSERELFSGYQEGQQYVWIKLSDPSGPLEGSEQELDMLHTITTERRAKAQEWRRTSTEKSTFTNNPFKSYAVIVAFFNGYLPDGRRNYQDGNLLWDVFKMMRKPYYVGNKLSYDKNAPLWLTTAPSAWREAFLAGMIESDGSREDDDSYRCSTIYPCVRDGLVAVGRSLGILTNAYPRNNDKEDWECRLKYVVYFGVSSVLMRVASLVASPRKRPTKAVPGSDWVRTSGRDSFTVTPKSVQQLATGFEVEGHRLLLANFLVIVDCNARELDTQEKSEEYVVDDRCIAKGCGKPFKGKVSGPSWDCLEGKLCSTHYARYKSFNLYCTECKDVPTLLGAPEFPKCSACSQPTLARKAPDTVHKTVIAGSIAAGEDEDEDED